MLAQFQRTQPPPQPAKQTHNLFTEVVDQEHLHPIPPALD